MCGGGGGMVDMAFGWNAVAGMAAQTGMASGGLQEVKHVRSVFPETWLWANTTLRYSILTVHN